MADGPVTIADVAAAATAVRLVEGGRTLWLASVSLPEACGDGSAPCQARRDLDDWRRIKREMREPTLIGGRMIGSPASGSDGGLSGACPSHGIDSDVAWHLLGPKDGNSSAAGTGCISIIRVGN